MKTAQQAAANWSAAMASPQTATNYKNGINNTSVNPMQMAATDTAMQNYINGCQRSIDTGKRAASLNNASLATWKTNATTYGAPALAVGAKKSAGKYQANIAKFAAVWPQMQAAAHALPKGGIVAAQARANAALAVLMQAAGYTS